jgi:electron transfer flavoprotein beta subunit
MRVAACVRWVDLRPEIDPLTGEVATDARRGGFSPADQAAVEVALAAGERWGATVDVVSVGGPEVQGALAQLAATGADRAVRVEAGDVAAGLAEVVRGAALVVCGDHSLDRGSGSTPAFLAARLGVAQALGLIAVELGDEPGTVTGVRRLGGGRAERVRVRGGVVSVEGAVAHLRRAPLRRALDATHGGVEVVRVAVPAPAEPIVVERGPWRPRARVLPPPTGDPRDRIVALTGALVDRTPPRTLELDPEAAADAILDQLQEWGYLDPAAPPRNLGDM